VLVAHLAFDFGLGREGCDAVDDYQVDDFGAREYLGDVERLLAGVGLADQQLLGLHPDRPSVVHVERVLGVDERAHSARLLRLGDRVQGQRGLSARLRAVDLDDATPRIASDPEGVVDGRGAGVDDAHGLDLLVISQPHDCALAEGLLDGGHQRTNTPHLVTQIDQHGIILVGSMSSRLWRGQARLACDSGRCSPGDWQSANAHTASSVRCISAPAMRSSKRA